MKANRDEQKLARSINTLTSGVKKGENENMLPYIIDAVEAKATVEEIMGTIRTTMGLSWDPWGYRTSPFK
jgi:methylmalonyl-CoA mutase N-terminal domain/subunit